MHVTHSLAREIRSYIKNLVSKDVVIVAQDGTCVSAEDQSAVGSDLAVPRDVFMANTLQTVTISGKSRFFIPLQHESETVAGLLVDDTDTAEIQNYAPLIKSFAELLVQQYTTLHKPVLDSTDQFITKLLHNATPADLPLYESEAQVLGYNLAPKRLAIVIHLHDFWNKCLGAMDQPSFERDETIREWKRKIETTLASFFTKSTDNIIAYIGNDRFVVFKGVDDTDEESVVTLLKKSHKAIFEPLKNFHITSLAVGLGNSYGGIRGLIDAYREANLALEFGSRLWGDSRSYYFRDLGILSILGEGNREKEMQYADQLLGKLTNEDLVRTLECFFEQNLNLTETAEKMKIHRNTVIYRLNQITTILGVDPRIFEQAMSIKIALLIKKLFI